LGSSGPDILPADSGPRVAQRLIAQSFGQGQVSPVQVVITDPRGVTGPGFPALFRLAHTIARDPEVTRVDSIATLVPGQSGEQAAAFVRNPISSAAVKPMIADDGRKTLLTVITRHGSLTPAVENFVKRLRGSLPSRVPGPATAAVGGDPGLNVDINNEMTGKLFPVVAIVLVLSFFILLLFFRSVLLPMKAIFMNTASVLAAYGLMVFVFQEGHAESLLDFRSVGFIDSFMPLFQFSILFGLSMDYEVFLLARIREEYLRTGDNTEAVNWGLEHTGGIITSAAAIMVVVFGAFAFTTLLPIKELGFGLATAVLLDATLVRVVLVPATMRLLGKWNWWLPGWLDRRLPNVSLEGLPPALEKREVVPAGV
jgi:RND superfamily putative drug exporter